MFNTNKKSALSCLLVLGLTSVSVNVQAQEERNLEKAFTQEIRHNQHEWYAGGSLANATLKPNVVTKNGKVTDDSAIGYKLYAGYTINDLFAIEVGYHDLGAAKVDTGTVAGDVDYEAISIQGIVKKKVTKKIRIMGKLGVASLSNKAKKSLKLKKINSTSAVIGIGGEYAINKRVSVRAEYEHFDKDYQTLSLGLNIKF